jgi:hypothetical protein
MHVTAFSTPRAPAWRWRIVNAAGDVIAESREGFSSIGAAIRRGTERLANMNLVDRSQPVNWRRSTSYLRKRSG